MSNTFWVVADWSNTHTAEGLDANQLQRSNWSPAASNSASPVASADHGSELFHAALTATSPT